MVASQEARCVSPKAMTLGRGEAGGVLRGAGTEVSGATVAHKEEQSRAEQSK